MNSLAQYPVEKLTILSACTLECVHYFCEATWFPVTTAYLRGTKVHTLANLAKEGKNGASVIFFYWQTRSLPSRMHMDPSG